MGIDDQAMQGARASVAIISTLLDWYNLIPAW